MCAPMPRFAMNKGCGKQHAVCKRVESLTVKNNSDIKNQPKQLYSVVFLSLCVVLYQLLHTPTLSQPQLQITISITHPTSSPTPFSQCTLHHKHYHGVGDDTPDSGSTRTLHGAHRGCCCQCTGWPCTRAHPCLCLALCHGCLPRTHSVGYEGFWYGVVGICGLHTGVSPHHRF